MDDSRSYVLPKSPIIYGILGPNDRLYVGSALRPNARLNQHRRDLRNNQHHCKHLQHAWNKYGAAAFDFKVLQECSVKEAGEILPYEQQWMDRFKDRLYNSTPTAGSLAGFKFAPGVVAARAAKMRLFKHSPETIELLRRQKLGRPSNNRGKVMSPEQRAHMSVSARLRPSPSEESRKKSGAALKRRYMTGWKPPRKPIRKPEVAAKVAELYRSDPNASATGIARAYGLRRHTVVKYLRASGCDLSARTRAIPSLNETSRAKISQAKAKLSRDQVLEIRFLLGSGEKAVTLADRYKVSKPLIYRVSQHRTPYNY